MNIYIDYDKAYTKLNYNNVKVGDLVYDNMYGNGVVCERHDLFFKVKYHPIIYNNQEVIRHYDCLDIYNLTVGKDTLSITHK